MSIINSLNTAVSGLNSQSHAFSDLSNNIANSQTTGYKAATTSFADYVTSNDLASDGESLSDSVAATTRQHTDNQGMVVSSTNTLALAISGNGFFNVVQPTGSTTSSTAPTFSSQQFYTRNGDFSQNNQGYLVNTSGYYLEGYQVGSEGALSSTLSPIKISDSVAFQPTKSTIVSLSAAIGSTSGAEGTNTSTATAYDSKGNAQEVSLNWKQSSTDPLVWTVSNSADSSNSATVKFNSDGSLASVNGASQSTGSAATFSYTGLPQDMTVNLGTIGSTSGVSLATDSSNYSTNPTMTTDSVTSGTFTGLSMQSDGSVMATFDNGLSQLLAKIPLSTFADPNGLSAQNGQAYTATASSGAPTVNAVNTNGAGTLSTSSTESSTTDLTSDLTKLIVAQQAYGANTKIVTTANQLLQTTLAMIQ
ncbi:flagellar hook protein FlgE [Gluconobacter cerinus]|uniref:Flagellar hook protein FlgE n=1 Tax=Gluconobacter cerinus TaxID=38307 RepID=A0AAV5NGA1_9PROT|nr:flagellar hook protein FlgE [Gluconobacter cerinus]MBS0993041.1 flagellar hook protein FlgE [Gluconobacter cerinus]MBS1021674.1 flagellar hook protein FlgE [Gluconobacter cerinus]GBQ99963.1 flagellar hook protein FlgE [Gluconobacter cerinus NRIC 0229]GLQ63383.1 flagellar hook protein FlgE [Gluconobacter cerinus]